MDLTDGLVQPPCLINEKTDSERGKMTYRSSHRLSDIICVVYNTSTVVKRCIFAFILEQS